MAIYSSGCLTAAQLSPPIPTVGAGGSCGRNGSCLGSVTEPFAPLCGLAWSVQASVSSTTETGGWQKQPKPRPTQPAACGCSHIPIQVGAVSTPAGHVLTSICSTLCQVFVPLLCVLCPSSVILSQTVTVKGLRAELFEESLTCLFSRFEKDPWHSVIIPLCWWLKICCQ